ncbi:MAG: endonuclease [Tannerellaceae bacterium]|nr:endonuclease [Tannerellaceae bacterium]
MKTILLFLVFFVCCYSPVYPQQSFRVMWYNVENLFDTYNNPDTDDDEFTPTGARAWTPRKYNHKLQQIAKVISAAGEWDTPALVGFCEVENDSVLVHLLKRTPLRLQQYRCCIANTSDNRGIRTALLYQRDKFRLINSESISVNPIPGRKTRDILHVWGETVTGDTLDVFVAHFPSRYGGELESEKRRIAAASLLRKKCDSLFTCRQSPYLLIMGDFNDTPINKSLVKVLDAHLLTHTQEPDIKDPTRLYNLLPTCKNKEVRGTHKYQGEWSQLDHILINGLLLNPSSTIQLLRNSVQTFAPSFLFTQDKTWLGIRPERTYHGFKYEAGYS